MTLRVDKYGFYLHWVDQHNEMDMLDIAVVKDARTGKYAKIPKVLILNAFALLPVYFSFFVTFFFNIMYFIYMLEIPICKM